VMYAVTVEEWPTTPSAPVLRPATI
jgi:hypothetical protein